jgi:hypothetical protein
VEELVPHVERQQHLVKGSRFMKMERVVAALTGAPPREVTDAARARAVAGQGRALFNVFNYITLRAVLACLTALACR